MSASLWVSSTSQFAGEANQSRDRLSGKRAAGLRRLAVCAATPHHQRGWAHNDAALIWCCAFGMHLCSDITPPTHPMAGQSEWALPRPSTQTPDWPAALPLIKVWWQHYELTIHQKFSSVLWQGNYWFEHHTAELLLIQSVSRLKSFSKRLPRAERSFRVCTQQFMCFPQIVSAPQLQLGAGENPPVTSQDSGEPQRSRYSRSQDHGSTRSSWEAPVVMRSWNSPTSSSRSLTFTPRFKGVWVCWAAAGLRSAGPD